jgi:HrpA-like RNA helicase
MTKLARVEITEKALRILKIETALSGMSQTKALEILIERGAGRQAIAIVEGKQLAEVEEKPLMEYKPQVEEIPQISPEESKANMHGHKKRTSEHADKHKMNTDEKAEKVVAALNYLFAETQSGREPTTKQVAEAIGWNQTPLGIALGRFDLHTEVVRRKAKSVRVFCASLNPHIEELLLAGESYIKEVLET